MAAPGPTSSVSIAEFIDVIIGLLLPRFELIATIHLDESDIDDHPVIEDMLVSIAGVAERHELGGGLFPVAGDDGLRVYVALM